MNCEALNSTVIIYKMSLSLSASSQSIAFNISELFPYETTISDIQKKRAYRSGWRRTIWKTDNASIGPLCIIPDFNHLFREILSSPHFQSSYLLQPLSTIVHLQVKVEGSFEKEAYFPGICWVLQVSEGWRRESTSSVFNSIKSNNVDN